MAYCVMNVDKQGRAAVYGLQIEANRTKEDKHEFDLSDIDKSRTEQNYYLAKTDHWNKEITRQIKAAGVKERKDSIVLITGVYTASPEWFDNHTEEDMKKYFEDCLEFHIKEYCQGDRTRLLNAVVHLDEKSPHLQIASVPLVADEKGQHLSAKIIMGNRSTYRLRQDRFYEEVGKHYDLERGERRDPTERKEHTTKREWQIATQEAQLQDTINKTLEAQKQLEDTNRQIEIAQEEIKPQIEAYNVISEGVKNRKKPIIEVSKKEVKDGLIRSHDEYFVQIPCKDQKDAEKIKEQVTALYDKNYTQEVLNDLILNHNKDLEREKKKQQKELSKAKKAFEQQKENTLNDLDERETKLIELSETYNSLSLAEMGFTSRDIQNIAKDSITEALVKDAVNLTIEQLESRKYLKRTPEFWTKVNIGNEISKSISERTDLLEKVREHIAKKVIHQVQNKDLSNDLTL